jgi:hypothetical protein
VSCGRPRRSSAQDGKAAVLAVVAVAVIALAGGAYYFLGVYLPKQKRVPAQEEIARWEERLASARACLLGDAPASGNTREALAIRELAPDPWNRRTCTQLIGKLSRGETEDTGLPAVEEAWRGLDRAAGEVAAAFLAHVDPDGEPAAGRDPERLPGALEGLEAAHAALRKAAELGPPPARPAGAALRTAEIIPLRAGKAPVTKLESWTMPTAGSVIAFGTAESREHQLTLVPGAAPVVRPVAAGVLRTVPEAPWGAVARRSLDDKGEQERHQIEVGPLDEAGNVPGRDPAASPHKLRGDAIEVQGPGRVFAVAGTADDGLVVAGGQSTLVLIRSKGGKLAADKPLEIEQLAFAIDPAGRALVAYNDGDGALHGFVGRGAAPAKVLDLGDTTAGGACLTASRGWIAGPQSDRIVSFDAPPSGDAQGMTPHDYPGHDLLGCTAEAALLHKRNAAHYVVCAAACRVATLAGMRPSNVAALAGDQVIAVVQRDHVLGVWREQGPPVFYTTGQAFEPRLATSDGKVIDVIAESAGGAAIIRIPAK